MHFNNNGKSKRLPKIIPPEQNILFIIYDLSSSMSYIFVTLTVYNDNGLDLAVLKNGFK